MKKQTFISSIILLMLFSSCKEGEQVACTEEFRTIGITVIGDSLTNFYTLRNSNSDTIRFADSYIINQWYPILDDSYQAKLANRQEEFTFIGEIKDTIVVNEIFIIKADECHIDKVSGKNEVTL